MGDKVRNIFVENLNTLVGRDTSVSAAAKRIGVNRTQFNKYRSGDALPGVDVLTKICEAYDIDERILSVPVSVLDAKTDSIKKAVRERSLAIEALKGMREDIIAGVDLSVDRIDAVLAFSDYAPDQQEPEDEEAQMSTEVEPEDATEESD